MRLRRALEPLASGARLRLLADDPMARIDVPHFLAEAGHRLLGIEQTGRVLTFTVEKRDAATDPGPGPDR